MNAYELSSQFLGGLVEEAKVVAKTRKTRKDVNTKAPTGKKVKTDLFLESIELVDEGTEFNFEDAMQQITKLITAGDKAGAKKLLDEVIADTTEEVEESVEEEEIVEDCNKVKEEAKANRIARRKKLREEARKERRQNLILESIDVVDEKRPTRRTRLKEESVIEIVDEKRPTRKPRLTEESKLAQRKALIRKAKRALRK